MAHVHEHHGSSTTVIDSDREGPATALIVLIGIVVLAAVIWFFAFSGVVFDRGTTTDDGPDVNIQNPPAQNDTNTNTNTDTDTQPNPVPS